MDFLPLECTPQSTMMSTYGQTDRTESWDTVASKNASNHELDECSIFVQNYKIVCIHDNRHGSGWTDNVLKTFIKAKSYFRFVNFNNALSWFRARNLSKSFHCLCNCADKLDTCACIRCKMVCSNRDGMETQEVSWRTGDDMVTPVLTKYWLQKMELMELWQCNINHQTKMSWFEFFICVVYNLMIIWTT